ncbi:Cytochrome P450 10 [Acropora cervicornis]|uniref:Cholesterol side-chain cleavage enzyme, mitochondrial n=1 Tax=Acropora cervicornis TaxID=6130 RepID=A0AAD9QED1_ACRCE|nr:Cytochrome P450 10 [Acropora cervicornis]
MIMACRIAAQPSRAFRSVYKGKKPSNLWKQIVLCSAHTQIEIPAKSFDEMPGPKGLPLIGTLLDYSKDLGGGMRGYQRMHEIQQQRAQQYGPIFREKIFNRQTVTISNPNDVEYLFRNEGKWPRRDPPFPLWEKYTQDRDRVRAFNFLGAEEGFRIRRILNIKMLKLKVTDGYAEPLNDVASDLITQMKAIRGSDGIIPSLQDELFKWSLESIGTVLFETRFGSFSKSPSLEAAKFLDSACKLFRLFLKIFLFPAWIDKFYRFKSVQEFYDHMDIMHNFGDMCINKKMSEIQGRLDKEDIQDEDAAEFLTFLIRREDISFKEITSNLIGLLFPAVETTSTTALWTLYLLARNPDVQKQLHDEVRSVLKPGENATPASLQKMPFLRGCVKETLRMYPAAWENARFLDEEIIIQGYRIPPNTMIRMPLYVMGRDPEIFDDPQQYKPERWLRDDTQRSLYHPFASLPFGFGPRMCIGRRVAELEMHLFLSQASQNFWVESLNEVQPVITSILMPDKTVELRFIDR